MNANGVTATLQSLQNTAQGHADDAETAEGNALTSYNDGNGVLQGAFATAMTDLASAIALVNGQKQCAQAQFDIAK